MEQIDLSTRIIMSAVDHWPLVAGLLVASYWVTPRVLKAFFLNGGGEIVRGLVRQENEAQSIKHNADLDRRFERIEDEVFNRRKRRR